MHSKKGRDLARPAKPTILQISHISEQINQERQAWLWWFCNRLVA